MPKSRFSSLGIPWSKRDPKTRFWPKFRGFRGIRAPDSRSASVFDPEFQKVLRVLTCHAHALASCFICLLNLSQFYIVCFASFSASMFKTGPKSAKIAIFCVFSSFSRNSFSRNDVPRPCDVTKPVFTLFSPGGSTFTRKTRFSSLEVSWSFRARISPKSRFFRVIFARCAGFRPFSVPSSRKAHLFHQKCVVFAAWIRVAAGGCAARRVPSRFRPYLSASEFEVFVPRPGRTRPASGSALARARACVVFLYSVLCSGPA